MFEAHTSTAIHPGEFYTFTFTSPFYQYILGVTDFSLQRSVHTGVNRLSIPFVRWAAHKIRLPSRLSSMESGTTATTIWTIVHTPR